MSDMGRKTFRNRLNVQVCSVIRPYSQSSSNHEIQLSSSEIF